ncbi:amino acid permease-domain-containing protein [Coniella lustricola]|uniref:Amino acid permease-domain-containing protein n=1 Tax=Coniella lustricola TaxID=2025994 RepID=A0A2T3AE43_9PEZI|nr:amino acid permease-domain-containing protein [Coniella lustricola]
MFGWWRVFPFTHEMCVDMASYMLEDVGAGGGSWDWDWCRLMLELSTWLLYWHPLTPLAGTGLFVGTGAALSAVGPAFLFIGYTVVCVLVYFITTATNEINTYMPLPGVSMAYYGNRMVSSSLGFAMGWMYWYIWGIGIAFEITAAAVVIDYWPNTIPVAVWITIMLVLIVALNFMPVKAYAETEFWFASIKVFTIVGLLILSVVLFFGGGPNHKPLYFSLWNTPAGAATKEYLVPGAGGRFCALLYSMIYSAFSFNFGPELLVITSGEMQSPRRNLPKAATRFIYRLLLFYCLGALAVGVICPSTDPRLTDGGSGAAASPWVIATSNAGIHGLDSIINAVIITSAWSSGNSVLYMSSRSLYSMAVAGNAPAVFKRCTRGGVPYYAVLASACFAPLAYLSVGSGSASVVFNWLVSLLNTAGFISWVCCCVIFLRFRAACKAQGVDIRHRSEGGELPYTSKWLQPWGAWVALVFFASFGLLNGFEVFFPGEWSVSGFFTAYIGIPMFLVFYLGHKLLRGRAEPWWRDPTAVDLKTGLAEIVALENEEEEAEAEAEADKERQKASGGSGSDDDDGEKRGNGKGHGRRVLVDVWKKPFKAVVGLLLG